MKINFNFSLSGIIRLTTIQKFKEIQKEILEFNNQPEIKLVLFMKNLEKIKK